MRKIAIALVAATALFAADSAYNYELTPTIGGVHPEGNLGMNEQAAIGLRVGRNLENFFIDQVEAGFNYANKVREYGVKGRAARYFVNAIKDFGITENFSIYGLLGTGYEDVSKRFIKNKDGGPRRPTRLARRRRRPRWRAPSSRALRASSSASARPSRRPWPPSSPAATSWSRTSPVWARPLSPWRSPAAWS